MADYYAITPDHVATLERLARRLYSEDRMDGDTMRNAAQALDAIARQARDLPVSDEAPPSTPNRPRGASGASEPHVIGTDAPTPENDPAGRYRQTPGRHVPLGGFRIKWEVRECPSR